MHFAAYAIAATLLADSAVAASPQIVRPAPVTLAAEDAAAVQAVEAMRRRVRVHAMNQRCDYAYGAARALGDAELLTYVSEMCGTPAPPPPPPETGTIKLWD